MRLVCFCYVQKAADSKHVNSATPFLIAIECHLYSELRIAMGACIIKCHFYGDCGGGEEITKIKSQRPDIFFGSALFSFTAVACLREIKRQ